MPCKLACADETHVGGLQLRVCEIVRIILAPSKNQPSMQARLMSPVYEAHSKRPWTVTHILESHCTGLATL